MADLMVRTGIDARGFKRGLYAMEKDLGDASKRMAGRFGGERGFDPFRLDKGAAKAGAMAIGFNPRTGLVGGLIIGLKDAYSALEKYEQKLPEVYRRTSDISSATGKIMDSWARGAGPVLDMFGGALDWIGDKYDRFTSSLGAFSAMVFGGGTAGPGQIDDFLKKVEYDQMRAGSKAERDAMAERSRIDIARLSGDNLTADLAEVDIWRREAIAKLNADKTRLMLTDPEYQSQMESINSVDALKRAEATKKQADAVAKLSMAEREAGDAREDAWNDELERMRKEDEANQKLIDDQRTKREDATVDIYEARARFRAAKATTDQEKRSAEEARAYARYKREELAIQRMGLDMDQETELSLFNQAEYEATIEEIRNRKDKPRAGRGSADGMDLSGAGAAASVGQAFAYSIPGKIDTTNQLIRQSNQTLREIKDKVDGAARFGP